MKKKKRRLGCGIWILIIVVLIGAVVAFLAIRGKQEKPLEVETAKVERRTLTSIVSATGKVQPVVEVKISSEVAGEIIELPVEEGQMVNRGDLLVRVKPDNYESAVRQREAALAASRAQSLQSRAQLLQAEQELRRAEELFERQFVSPAELEEARTQVEVRRALFEASQFEIEQQDMGLEQARENLLKTTTLAPMDGTISLLDAKLGERVVGTGQFAGTEILRLADLANMEVRIEVNENDVVNVSVGDRARVSIDAYRGRSFDGHVTHIANSARTAGERSSEQVTTFEVRIRLPDAGVVLRPGMTAVAEIETATAENVVAVPVQAVTVRDRRDLEGAATDKADPTKPAEGEQPATATEPAPASDGSGTATATPAERPRGAGTPGANGSRRDRGRDRLQRVVFVRNGDRAVLREVTTGISDPTHLEILTGLQEGDEVISGPYTAVSRELKDASLIKVRDKATGPGGAGRPGGPRP